MTNEINFKSIEIKSKKIKGLSINLNWDCSEGVDGEYDPENPHDEPLLRFDICYRGNFVEDGSYCTQLRADDNRDLLTTAAKCILKDAEDTLSVAKDGYLIHNGFKRRMEEASWIKIRNGEVL